MEKEAASLKAEKTFYYIEIVVEYIQNVVKLASRQLWSAETRNLVWGWFKAVGFRLCRIFFVFRLGASFSILLPSVLGCRV